MEKRKLSYILAHTDIEKLKKEVEKLKTNHKISKVKEPEIGLAMVKVKDGVYNENFYIGEILITECSVHFDGTLGIGIIQDDNPEKAYFMSVIDAAFNCKNFNKEELTKTIEKWKQEIKDKYIEEKAMVEGSKVKFETMGE